MLEAQSSQAGPGGAVRVEAPGEGTFLERQISSSPRMRERAGLFRCYFDSPTPREELAPLLGMPKGQLLRIFNDTAPLGPPLRYRFGGASFVLYPMAGLCDDFHGERFGKFGAPLTLRLYLTAEAGLPAEFFEAADWNFMDAGLPYFVAYAYGTRLGDTLFFSGLQSDVAQRYTYLYLGRGEGTEVREGLETSYRQTEDLRTRFGAYVPLFRRLFQRRWVDIVLAGVLCYVLRERGVEKLAFQQFPLLEEEDAPGHIVHRIYRGLPRKLTGHPLIVSTERSDYSYHCVTVAELTRHLGEQWKPEQEL